MLQVWPDDSEESIMRVYLAAPWIDRARMPGFAEKLEQAGHFITWKWWSHEGEGYAGRTHAQLAEFAMEDYNGVVEADVVVVISSSKSEGKAVEQGIALSKGKKIIAVGTLSEFPNIFHYLSNYQWVKTIEEAVMVVNSYISPETAEWIGKVANACGPN